MSATDKITIHPLDPENSSDMLDMVHIHYAAFKPISGILFHCHPNDLSSEGYQHMALERAKSLRTPTMHGFKAVAGTKTLGCSIWKIFEHERSTAELDAVGPIMGSWAPEQNAPAWEALGARLRAVHREVLGGAPCVVLSMLVIDPEHQRQGVGRALLQWGLDRADELGVVAYVESSAEGKRLYEKAGFRTVRNIGFDGKPFGQEERFSVDYAMIREPQKSGSD